MEKIVSYSDLHSNRGQTVSVIAPCCKKDTHAHYVSAIQITIQITDKYYPLEEHGRNYRLVWIRLNPMTQIPD